jgi:threonyl-tRNA synthetase
MVNVVVLLFVFNVNFSCRPFWLSPRQGIVVSVADKHNEYADKVQKELHAAGYYVDSDLSDKTIPKKVREAQLAQYNYILVVGDEEVGKNTVNVRTRDNIQHGQKTVAEMLAEFATLTKEFK